MLLLPGNAGQQLPTTTTVYDRPGGRIIKSLPAGTIVFLRTLLVCQDGSIWSELRNNAGGSAGWILIPSSTATPSTSSGGTRSS